MILIMIIIRTGHAPQLLHKLAQHHTDVCLLLVWPWLATDLAGRLFATHGDIQIGNPVPPYRPYRPACRLRHRRHKDWTRSAQAGSAPYRRQPMLVWPRLVTDLAKHVFAAGATQCI